jgi:hypothetical protein
MAVKHAVILSVHTPVDGVEESVPAAVALDDRGRENPLAFRRERHVDRVVHPARHHRFEARAVGAAAKDVGGARLPLAAVHQVRLLGEGALAPVNPTVGARIGTVQVVRAAGKGLALEPLDAVLGHAVAIAVGELPDARRRRHVERAALEHGAGEEHHPIGEHDALVEPAVAIDVFKTNDAMGTLGELLLDGVV